MKIMVKMYDPPPPSSDHFSPTPYTYQSINIQVLCLYGMQFSGLCSFLLSSKQNVQLLLTPEEFGLPQI